jgi:hypothetical protein
VNILCGNLTAANPVKGFFYGGKAFELAWQLVRIGKNGKAGQQPLGRAVAEGRFCWR